MPKYYLNDNEKHLVRMMARGLQDGSVKSTWTLATGDDRIQNAWGASPELNVEIHEGRLQQSEFDNLVDCGLLQRSNRTQYTLSKQQIIQAVENDFEEPINIELEPAQRELLVKLVEAARNVPTEKRQEFFSVPEIGRGGSVSHPGLIGGELEASNGDLRILLNEGLLLLLREHPYDFSFEVTPLGYKLYTQIKRRLGQPVERISTTIRSYLDAHQFRQHHPKAYAKWTDAEARLWGTDVDTQLTTIGHLCREAMQEFATELVEKYKPPNVLTDKQNTKNRVGEVIKMHGAKLGDTEKPFLDALFGYWEQLILLVNRQEHGGQREKATLVWEDARRVVFQTAVTMFEIDRALSR
ncbi:hypothetical protein ANRL4_01628 [Anaerolineae bacterium]|nr:hypothetical protein ANRL4_01628 [Anaerolineae bacterium]